MEKIKIGIIGMGRMGITHFSIINSHPQVQVCAVADTSDLLLDVLHKYKPEVQIFGDYKSLIEKSGVDAIIVCTPPNLHFEICRYAAEFNLHVFCEKPFTTDPEQARELASLFAAKKLVNQVGYVLRFNDIFMTARKYIHDGVIGRVFRFKSEMFSNTVNKPQKGGNWRSKRENGGGVTYEMGSHAIDLLHYMLGSPEKIIGSSMNQVYSVDVEDIVSTTLLYKNDVSGTIYVNWCDESFRKPSNKLEFWGDKGKLLADQHGMKLFLKDDNAELNFRKGWNTIHITDVYHPTPFYVRGGEFTRQLYHFADTILGKENDLVCNFEDGYNSQHVIHAIFNDFTGNKGYQK